MFVDEGGAQANPQNEDQTPLPTPMTAFKTPMTPNTQGPYTELSLRMAHRSLTSGAEIRTIRLTIKKRNQPLPRLGHKLLPSIFLKI